MRHLSSSSSRQKGRQASSSCRKLGCTQGPIKKWAARDAQSNRSASTTSHRLADYDVSQNAIGSVDNPLEPLMDQDQTLPELVWKYFVSEIREALLEAQAAFAKADAKQKLRLTQ